MKIDPKSFDAFVVYSENQKIRYFSGSAELAEFWFNNEYPKEKIIKIESDEDYNASMWGRI